MKGLLTILFVITSLHMLQAQNNTELWNKANKSYSSGDFKEASAMYQQIIDAGVESSELYFNLGNAYFKTGNIPSAILNYERAKKMNPTDEEIEFNLKIASQRTVDKIDPLPQLFFTELGHGVIGIFSEKTWSLFCIAAFVLCLILLGIFLSVRGVASLRVFIWSALFVFVVFVSLFFIARSSKQLAESSMEAIIILPSVTVKSSPDNEGSKLFILHEGTKVKIEKVKGDWHEIRAANGNVGWIERSAAETI